MSENDQPTCKQISKYWLRGEPQHRVCGRPATVEYHGTPMCVQHMYGQRSSVRARVKRELHQARLESLARGASDALGLPEGTVRAGGHENTFWVDRIVLETIIEKLRPEPGPL